MQYVATFFSHYDAVLFVRRLRAANLCGTIMPVPRQVSSSCGSGVRFETQGDVAALDQDGVERIFAYQDGAYALVFERAGA